MKTLKQFVSTYKAKEDPVIEEQVEQEPEILFLEDEPLMLDEKENHGMPHDPPAVLIMRRKQIRQFPGGQRVALYYVDKLNKYVTVPYEGMGWSAPMPEETQIEENVIHHLKNIVDNHSAKAYKFKDGKSMKIDVQTAQAVLNVHKSVNDDNKKKIEDMASKSKHHFTKVVDFAWKHTKLK